MNGDDKLLLAKNESGEIAPAEAARALASAATEAGKLALKMLDAGVRTWNKERNSPVTEADIAVDALLRKRLRGFAADYGWQSEESADVQSRPGQRRRWVVDPIDGTRSFIKKLPDWSIATALLEDGRPIAAALYAPVTDELFVATAGGGAVRNGVPIRASAARALDAARIAGPRMTLERLTQSGLAFETVPRIHSLALRFARVASGEIDAALASERSRDWDVAAADLLVHEAGGTLTTFSGEKLVYGRPEAEHPALAASGMVLHPALRATLTKVDKQP
ncbi:MAG: 3'(2'),5'-bisphosphate nucleotidase CysQ [Xanthobacteraceae bacterium]